MTGITPYSTALQQIGYGSNRQTTTVQRRNTTDKDSVKNGKSGATGSVEAGRQTSVDKPVWNSRQVFNYIEDMGSAGIAYGEKAKKYYVSQTMQDGELSVDELKRQIQEWFPDYTLTDREPKKVVNGKHYLYIDDSQLAQMARDPEYRGRVYGLMDRELETGRSYTMKYSDGRNVTSHITGSVFSLCEKNRKYDCGDGIPYLGSCMSDHPFSSSDSHPMVRSMSYLRDNLDPAKSAAKSRATLAAKKAAEKAKAKKTAEKVQAKKAAEKAQARKTAEKVQARKQAAKLAEKRQAESLKPYFSQIGMQVSGETGRKSSQFDQKM